MNRVNSRNDFSHDEWSYQLSHVWDKALLTDARNRKSVLMKTSDRMLKLIRYIIVLSS